MYEHNALGYRSGLALCLTKVRSSQARCPATALIIRGLFINNVDFCCKMLTEHSMVLKCVLCCFGIYM